MSSIESAEDPGNTSTVAVPKRASLTKIILICITSYIGYLVLGTWCYLIEQEHSEKYEDYKKANPDWADKGLVLELGAAISLIVFAIVRLLSLGLFCLEKVVNVETVSITWLSISTILMMVAYFTACLNLDVFYHIHPAFITLFFVSIGIDFLGNVLVIIRHNYN